MHKALGPQIRSLVECLWAEGLILFRCWGRLLPDLQDDLACCSARCDLS